MRRNQLLNKTPIEYAKLFWGEVLRCNQVYDEFIQKCSFIKVLEESIHQSIRLYRSSNKHETFYELARHQTSPSSLQNGSH